MSRKQLPSYNCRVTKGIFLPAVLSLATKLRTFFQIATVIVEERDKFIAPIERYNFYACWTFRNIPMFYLSSIRYVINN